MISEDDWLSALFSEEMSSVRDYVRVSEKLRRVMAPHVSLLLQSGVSVVLDFPANTLENRAWMREIFEDAGAAHELHVLDAADEVCLKRLHARNTEGDHPFATTEAQFRQVSRHFVPPSPEEGFILVVHAVRS